MYTIAHSYDVVTYSTCPRYALYTWNKPRSFPHEVATFSRIIHKVYQWRERYNDLPTWKHVKELGEDELTSDVHKENVSLLSKLRVWYDLYLEEYCDEGIINLPIVNRFDNILVYKDIIPLTTVGKKLRVYDVRMGDQHYCGRDLYNDLLVQTRLWGFWKASDTFPEEYVRYIIQPTVVRPVHITTTKDLLSNKIEPIIKHILRGMRDDIFYPSKSKHCDTCPFASACEF